MKARGDPALARKALKKKKESEEEPPELDVSFIFYWRAFFRLSTCRNNGMGVSSIPWDAMDRYCYRWNITDHDEFDFFVEVIESMDSVFLNHHQEEREKEEKERKRKENLKKSNNLGRRGKRR